MSKINLTAKKLDRLKPNAKRLEYWDKSLPGFVLRVTPDGTKTFSVSYRIAGQRRRYTVGSYPGLALADAREQARNALELVRRGIDPVEETKRRQEEEREHQKKGLTFEDLATRFLDEHVKSLRSRYWVKRSFDKELIPQFEKTKADELKRAAVRDYLHDMARTRPTLANLCHAYLRKMYNWALSMELVEYNPCAGISQPGKNQRRDRVLSEDEIKAIWKTLDQENPVMAATYRLRLLTAQRGGEVHSMRWKDIDGDWWTIPAEFTKNRLSHRVPLSPQAMRVLEQVREFTGEQDRNSGRGRSEWVFPKLKDHTAHIDEVRWFALHVRQDSKVDYRAHDFRRTAASKMAGMGVPRLVISKILNHVEPGITKVYDRYSYDNEKREALHRWGRKLMETISGLEPVEGEHDI